MCLVVIIPCAIIKKKKSQPANVAGWIIVIRWMLQQNKRLQPLAPVSGLI
jgi:hypothetical protein